MITLAATFTADPIADVLRLWMAETGVARRLVLAPYNQVVQHLVAPDGVLRTNRRGLNVVLVRLSDWGAAEGATPRDPTALLAEALAGAAASGMGPAVVVRCPEPPARERRPPTAEAERRLVDRLAPVAGVTVVTAADVAALYPVADTADPHADASGAVPYTGAYFAALGTAVARRASALARPPYKVLALDCDGTLWGGACGEVPPHALGLGPGHLAVQRLARDLARDGWLVCLCSKNAEADVRAVFDARPDFPLSFDRVAAHRINWAPKSDNLRALAVELGLGLDAFVFLDDNPVECAEVRAGCPAVLALTLPAQPERVAHLLRHVWAFDRLAVTDEDRRRTALYAGEARRRAARAEAASFEAFLAGLDLHVEVAPAAAADLARVAQLTQRTNQFNTTGARLREADLSRDLDEPARDLLAVRVRDRFGDYGLTGAVRTRSTPDGLSVDGWWLSCRVLGRGVEHAVLRAVAQRAAGAPERRLTLAFAPTPRNEPAAQFLDRLDADRRPGGYALPIGQALTAVYRPPSGPPHAPPPAARAAGPPDTDRPAEADWMPRAATTLSTVEGVLDAVAQRQARPRATPVPFVEPRTQTERLLAAIWRGVLHVDRVGALDSFFELGGDSLTGTIALGRASAAVGVDLPLDGLFDAPTLEEQAARLVRARLDHLDPSLLRQLLATESPNGAARA